MMSMKQAITRKVLHLCQDCMQRTKLTFTIDGFKDFGNLNFIMNYITQRSVHLKCAGKL